MNPMQHPERKFVIGDWREDLRPLFIFPTLAAFFGGLAFDVWLGEQLYLSGHTTIMLMMIPMFMYMPYFFGLVVIGISRLVCGPRKGDDSWAPESGI